MGRRKKGTRPRIDTPHQRKMSEIIWEFAGDFIGTGDSPEERQSILNAACSAWSIACNPPEMRGQHLDHYLREFRRFNLGADEEQLAFVRSNMEKLIEQEAGEVSHRPAANRGGEDFQIGRQRPHRNHLSENAMRAGQSPMRRPVDWQSSLRF